MNRWCRHFEAAQHAFRNFDLAGALEHLARVQAFAPNLAGARNGIAKVRQRQADIARVQLAYETARAGGRLVSARGAVEAWSKLVDPESPELQAAWSEVARGLRRAESLAARARNLERTDPAAARDLYRQSLAIAADLPDALTGLKRTPPDPPTALDGQVHGDRIRLSWTPPPPDGLGSLTFVVVRKGGGALLHPGDGTRIAEVSTCEFDDTHATPGDTVGYAVLSKRGGVESVTAISLGPFVFLADVKDVRVELHHHEVELAWTLPRGVSDVRVIRKQGGPPKNPRDGERIPAALDHALDRNVDPNEIYHYGIYAIYAMADGRLFPSPGVVVSARPQPPVSALEAPRLLLEPGGRVRIDWIEPARGSVKILRTAHPLPLAAGTRLATAEAEALSGHWIEPAGSRSSLRPRTAGRGALLLHAADRLGGNLHRRPRRRPQPRRGPVRPACDTGRQRPWRQLRRNSRHAPLAMGRGSKRVPGRRSPGHAATRARRSRSGQGDRSSGRLRPSGLLDAQLAIKPPRRQQRRCVHRFADNQRRIRRRSRQPRTLDHGISGFTA